MCTPASQETPIYLPSFKSGISTLCLLSCAIVLLFSPKLATLARARVLRHGERGKNKGGWNQKTGTQTVTSTRTHFSAQPYVPYRSTSWVKTRNRMPPRSSTWRPCCPCANPLKGPGRLHSSGTNTVLHSQSNQKSLTRHDHGRTHKDTESTMTSQHKSDTHK